MKTTDSQGKCHFCNKTFSKRGMSRHLASHLGQIGLDVPPGKSFHLKVEQDSRWGHTPHFLHLWVDGQTTIEKIDQFLRAIWLECCGHMSSFQIASHPVRERDRFASMDAYDLLEQGNVAEYERIMEKAYGQLPLKRKAAQVFTPKLKINYEYDFGSSTNLEINILGEYPVICEKGLVLLSRNEPFAQPCAMCGKKTSVQLCSVCMYEGDALFCTSCAKKHAKNCADFADYAAMPLVNSPRAGVCAYEGGTIDTQRDLPK